MKCPECGLEMILYETGKDGDVYACRNPNCPAFDKRLQKPETKTK